MSAAPRPPIGREGAPWTRLQRLKNDIIYALIAALIAIVTRLPRAAVRSLCRALGALAYLTIPAARRRARARLAAGIGAPASPRRVRRAFNEISLILADTLALLRPTERASSSLSLSDASRSAFRGALDEGRGVVFVSAHIGPWERMAALLVEEGFPVSAVARESYDRRITELYERIRAPRGVRSIYRGRPGALVTVARELAAGRAVGFLIDIPGRGLPSVTSRLFGEDAELSIGPAKIALARGAAVVVGTCVGSADGAPTVAIERVPTGDLSGRSSRAIELHARIIRILDDRIRLSPDAWLGLFAPARLPPSADHR